MIGKGIRKMSEFRCERCGNEKEFLGYKQINCKVDGDGKVIKEMDWEWDDAIVCHKCGEIVCE